MGSCNSGGKGGSSALKNKIAGLEVDLKYANMMVNKYGNVKYGGTSKTREMFHVWNEERRKIQNELLKLYERVPRPKSNKKWGEE